MTTDMEHRLRAAFEARTAAVPAPPEPDWEAAPAPAPGASAFAAPV
ncbi:hypothetical protein ACFQHO_04850 [Actinomadura yumaensis]